MAQDNDPQKEEGKGSREPDKHGSLRETAEKFDQVASLMKRMLEAYPTDSTLQEMVDKYQGVILHFMKWLKRCLYGKARTKAGTGRN